MTLKQDKANLLKKIETWEKATNQLKKINQKITQEEEKLQAPFELGNLAEYLEINKTPLEEINRLKKVSEEAYKALRDLEHEAATEARDVIAQQVKEDEKIKAITQKYNKELNKIVKSYIQIRELEEQVRKICTEIENEWEYKSAIFSGRSLAVHILGLLPFYSRYGNDRLNYGVIEEINEFLES